MGLSQKQIALLGTAPFLFLQIGFSRKCEEPFCRFCGLVGRIWLALCRLVSQCCFLQDILGKRKPAHLEGSFCQTPQVEAAKPTILFELPKHAFHLCQAACRKFFTLLA